MGNNTESNNQQPTTTEPLSQELVEMLTRMYGPLLGSRDLWKVLGYSSQAAYRQARIRQRLPVKEFKIEGRRGRFALTLDVAHWLAEQRLSIAKTIKDQESANEEVSDLQNK